MPVSLFDGFDYTALGHILAAVRKHLALDAECGAVQRKVIDDLHRWHLAQRCEGLGLGDERLGEAIVHLIAVFVFRARNQPCDLNREVGTVGVGLEGMSVGEIVPAPHLHLDTVYPTRIGIDTGDDGFRRPNVKVFPFDSDCLRVGVGVLMTTAQCGAQRDKDGRQQQ